MKRVFLHGLIGLWLVLVAAPVAAVWVEGVGEAVIADGDTEKAREQARNAALRNAALQYEVHVASSDTVSNGVLTDTRLTVVSSANVHEIRNEHSSRHGQRMRVSLEARLSNSPAPDCGGKGRSEYSKRVGIAGFHVINPDQGGIGRLEGLERAVPERIAAELAESRNLRAYSATHLKLFEDGRNAPTRLEHRNRLTNALELADEMNVQFVVSGVVRDFGVEEPDTWGSSVWRSMRRGLGTLNRERRFVLDLFIHDGLSGAPILQQRFTTSGTWDRGPGDRTGFATAAFDNTPYGEKVNQLLAQVAKQVDDGVACQPFMAKVERVDNHNVRIGAGASSGIRPGDTLRLYRRERFLELPNHMPELHDSHTEVKIRQVHPDFSSGEMPVQGGRVNIQRGDMVIAW